MYILSENDKKVLLDYNVLENEFLSTTKKIEREKRLRPWEVKMPVCYKIGLGFLGLLVIAIYLYCSLIFLELALFNVILLGILLVGLSKVYYTIFAFMRDLDEKYRNSPLKRFIEAENMRLYSMRGLILIVGKEGKWLEVQLPDTLEDQQKDDELEAKLAMGGYNSRGVSIPEDHEEDKLSVETD